MDDFLATHLGGDLQSGSHFFVGDVAELDRGDRLAIDDGLRPSAYVFHYNMSRDFLFL